MKTGTALLALIAGLGAIAGLSQVTTARVSAEPERQAEAAARGAKAWADNCASCHNMRSPLEKSDRQWAIAATHMRVRANLPGDVVDDIILFLQSSNEKAAAPVAAGAAAAPSSLVAGDAARGAAIYAETCIACHGANGKGAIEGVPDLTGPSGRLTKSDELLLRHMIQGFQSPGSPMPMPAKGGNPDLTDQDMADALAYLRKSSGQ